MLEEFRSPLADDANAGRIAIVTGGGTGIGRATARELARTGAAVAICGRRPEPLEDARGELEAAGRRVFAMPCDVREPEQVEAFLDAVEARLGPVDVLINNAGGQFAAPLESIALKGLRAVHRLNVDAPGT
jgi:citronellol/citronellal dehydrogenase